MSNAQRKTLSVHRSRRRDAAMVRVQVQVLAMDAQIIRDIASVFRGDSEAAEALRVQLRSVAVEPRNASAFEIFGSDLPDAYFEGVLGYGRCSDTRRDVEF
jgi:hypothetical protein